jgi:hypothetical protein
MAKPCGFAIEFNPLGTPPLSLYSSTRDGAPHAGVDDGVAGAARCAWTGGRSGGVAHRASAGWAAVLRPVPSPRQTTTVLWGGEGGPSAGALVQAAVRPGAVLRRLRARPSEACTHLCAEPEHVVGVWDGAGVGNPAGGACASRDLMAQSERLLRRVRAAVTESHTRWELLRL